MITASGPFVFLDIGANPDSTGENLYQYAEMGALFSERVLGVARPRVALLSIGEERGKGDARIVVATQLLDAVRPRTSWATSRARTWSRTWPTWSSADAVVGNVVIKFFEGLSTFIFDLLREEFRRPPRGPHRLRPDEARHRPDPGRLRLRAFGGSPLLGVRGTVIITHGRAKRRMVGYAVGVGAAAARARIPEHIAETFQREPARAADAAAAAAVAGSPIDEVTGGRFGEPAPSDAAR